MEASRDSLRQRPIMVCQLIRTEPQGGQRAGIRAVRDTLQKGGGEHYLDERERVAALAQVRWMKCGAAEGAQHLSDGVLRRF